MVESKPAPSSLGPEFFDQREEAIRSRDAAGELEVEHFMRSKRLRFGLLMELGYFEECLETMSTADLFVYRIPRQAKAFFSEDRDLQLIFVRTVQASKLAVRLREKVRAGDPAMP
jgi:hypothetical protein